MKYYYFHGYGSSPNACKAEAMREILGAENVSAPDFNVSPEEVSNLFDKLIDEISLNNEEVCIVGSSLGGLYALYVAVKVSGWVTDDPLINHSVLTKPYFYKGVKEYIEFDTNTASGHEFTGFKNVFEKYIKNYK